jgi:hypothetical protein
MSGVRSAQACTAAGDTHSTIEPFSDTGPYAYGDWLNGVQSRAKPDITGTDAVTVSGAGGFGGGGPFFGTSAASPNVGAVIALLRGFAPGAAADASDWKQVIMASANPDGLTNFRRSAAGSGLLDATAAAAAIDPPLGATITAPTGHATQVKINKSVSFTGECEYAGPLPLSYDWTFGANSGVADSHDRNPTVTFKKPGTYKVTFSCSDSLNASSASTSIEVAKPSSGGGGGFGGLALGVLAGLGGLAFLLRRKG